MPSTDLVTFYRDVLAVQGGGDDVGLTNAELRPAIDRVAAASRPGTTLSRMEAILAAPEAVEANRCDPAQTAAVAWGTIVTTLPVAEVLQR